MFCEKCESFNSDIATTCFNCGAKLSLKSNINPIYSQYELANRGSRLGAAILDFLIVLIGITIGVVLTTVNEEFGVIMMLLICFALIITQIYLLVSNGQTIGKRILGIKIVSFADGSHPGVFRIIFLRYVLIGIITAIPIVGGIFELINILFIFREDRRCIHDLIANTTVIKL